VYKPYYHIFLCWSCLVSILNEIVGELLDGVGGGSGLLSFLVDSDDEALSSLDTAHAIRSLLAINGSVISLEGEIFGSSDGDSGGESIGGVVEECSNGGTLSRADGVSIGGGPGVAIQSEESSLGNSSSSNQLIIDV